MSNQNLKKNQRSLRNLLINPGYQVKYIFWISAPGLFLVALNAAIFYHYVSENYTILVDLSPMTAEAKALLYSELNEIVVKLVVISLGFMAVISGLGLVLSHRTAGPMFHFKKVFAAIRGGDREARVRLRPTDDFQDVAETCNDMLERILKK